MARKRMKASPGLTAEVATRMTPTIGAPAAQVGKARAAKAEPGKLAKVKGRSAKARFTGSRLKT